MKKAYRFIGKHVPRKDGIDIVTGATKFNDDIRMSDLLHGQVLRSPHAHANIKRINTDKARGFPGVKAVLTWEDIPDWRGGMTPTTRVLDNKVRYVGDAVAIVAATSRDAAREALELIEVEYEILPMALRMSDAQKKDATPLYDQYPDNILPAGVPGWGGDDCLKEIVMGNTAEGFSQADTIVEEAYEYNNLPNPLPPESPAAIGLWKEPNQMIIWVSDQSFYKHIGYLKRVVDESIDIRTFGGPCGASYGSKSMSWLHQLYAVLLSRATGCPVKMTFSKEEHLASFILRPSSRIEAKVGIKKDGTVTAVSGLWQVGTGYYSQTTQAQVAVGCGEAQLAIRCKNWDLKNQILCSNRNASGIVRGFGGQELKCSLIPILSHAMKNLDIDPVAFFKKNVVKPGDRYSWRDGSWNTYRGVDIIP